jgi:hypothetical protein
VTHFLISLTLALVVLPALEWATHRLPHYIAVIAAFAAGAVSLAVILWINGRIA